MKHSVTELLLEQTETFAFRFTCEECVHFSAHLLQCSLGYPAAPRAHEFALHAEVVFCKEFDLGGAPVGGEPGEGPASASFSESPSSALV